MAAPNPAAAGTYREGSSSTPSFANPGGIAAGSVVVLEFFLDAATTVSAPPTGFVHAPGSPLAVNVTSHSIVRLWKRFSGADASAFAPTLSANAYSAGRTYRVEGCIATGDPWDTNSGTGTAVATDATNGTVTPAVSMTTQAADELLWFGGSDWSGGTWTQPSAGGTWTEQQDTGDGVSTVDTKSQAVAGATGSVTATCTGSDKRGALLGALMSVAPGGGGTSLNAGNDALSVAGNAASLAVGAQAGNDALAVAANAATLATKIPTGNDAVSVAANSATLKAAVPAGGAALSVAAFNVALVVGTQIAVGNAAVAVAANSATLKAAPAVGGAALAVAANSATLAAATPAGGAAAAVAANAASLRVATAAGNAAASVGAFNVSLLAGGPLAVGAGTAAVGAFNVQLVAGGSVRDGRPRLVTSSRPRRITTSGRPGRIETSTGGQR